MGLKPNRRTILRALAGGAGALCLPRAAVFAQDPPAAALEITKLGDGLFVVAGAGCNVVVDAKAPEAAVVIDGGSKERSGELTALLRAELGVTRVGTLFNSCWHPDRTGLNAPLGAAGAKIVANENTKLWLGRDVTTPWNERTTPRLPKEALPNVTFYDTGTADTPSRKIRYGYLLQAHTDGDLYVHFPDDKLLVTGAAISSNSWPLLDWWTGGWIGGLVDALDLLLGVADADTRVIPGQGAPLTRAGLVEQREIYGSIFDRLAKMFFAGLEPDDVLAARPTREFEPRFGDSELFLKLAFRGFGLHFGPDA
jgi:glyoxylase-like metal-dependent hydrolase (beta-lactamase superfamily II)